MSIRKKDLSELEQYSYTDLAYEILKEDKKGYNTPKLFKEVCKLLKLDESEYEAKIGDFFTALSTDQRFILLDSSKWDLKENHVVDVVVDEGEDDEEVAESETDEEDEEIETEDDMDEDDYSEDALDDDIAEDDGMDDLTIIDEDEEEEE